MTIVEQTDWSQVPDLPVLTMGDLYADYENAKERHQSALDCYYRAKREASRFVYVADKLTPGQLEALKSMRPIPTDFNEGKNKAELAQQQMTAVFGLIMSPMMVVSGLCGSPVIVWALGIMMLLCSVVLANETIEPVNNAYRRLRGKGPRVQNVKTYALNGPVVAPLQSELGKQMWHRLLNSEFDNDNQELGNIFVDYHDDVAEILESIREIEQSSVPEDLSQQLISQLNEKVDRITDDAVVEIERIFSEKDINAMMAQMQAKEEAEQAEFVRRTADAMNDQFLNQALVTKAAYVLSKQ